MNGTGLATRPGFTRALKAVAIIFATLLLVGAAQGNQRATIPPDPYAPIYLDWYGDGEQVAFIFYRPPECVPPDFDLLEFFDIPNAFNCNPLTVEGFVIYKDEFVPRQANLTGLGEVPVWFISAEDYNSAIADEKLEFWEISQSPSLIEGHAEFYKETRQILGAHPVPKVNIVAAGVLDDATDFESFWFHVFWETAGNVNVKIELE